MNLFIWLLLVCGIIFISVVVWFLKDSDISFFFGHDNDDDDCGGGDYQ